MPAHCEPWENSPVERLSELCHIFAIGVIRLRQIRHLIGEPAIPSPERTQESALSCLEVSGETVLSVHTG